MDAELDIDDLPPKVLRKMIRQMMAKKNKKPGDKDEEGDEKADEEREALADLHAEGRGKPPEIAVTEDDLPESLRGDSDEDKEDEPKAKKKGK
jgi:hypothetical protein